MLLNEAVKKYLRYITEEKKLSRVSIKSYSRYLNYFVDYYHNMELSEFDREALNRYISYLEKDKKYEEMRTVRYLQPVRYMLEYLELQGIECLSPAYIGVVDKKIFHDNKEKLKKYQREILTRNEIILLRKYWESSYYEKGVISLRNQLIIYLLSTLGLTVSELANTYISDLNLSKMTIKIKPRNKQLQHRERVLSITPEIVSITKLYLSRRNDNWPELIVGFGGIDVDFVKTAPLSDRQIQKRVVETATEVGIEKNITPSIFRNTKIVSTLAEEDMDLVELRKYFGYSYSSSAGYQRFLPIAKKEIGIDGWVKLEDISLKYVINKTVLLKWSEKGLIKAVKWRGRWYISPDKKNTNKILYLKRQY